jgi:site-specific recombinase XerD
LREDDSGTVNHGSSKRGRSQTRPQILLREEVAQLIAAPRQLKHRALLSMVYGSGLLVSEVINVHG